MGICRGSGRWCLFCVLLILTPFFVGDSLAASNESVINVGMKDEPKTLNPFKASDSWSLKVVHRFYEPLYTREPKTHKIIPWLAEGYPEYDEATNTAIVRLKRTKWEDGSPLTAHDVVFTGRIIREFRVPRYHYAWRFIKEIEALGVTVKDQYAVLGSIDFVNIVEAPDNQTIARVSAELSARGSVRIQTLAAIPIDDFIATFKK